MHHNKERKKRLPRRTRFLCINIEPTWLQPELQFLAAPLLSPTSTAHEKAHEIGEKEACLGMRTRRLPLGCPFFLRLRVYVTGSSTRCSHRPTIHSCNHGRSAHRRSLDETNKQNNKDACSPFRKSIFTVWHGMNRRGAGRL